MKDVDDEETHKDVADETCKYHGMNNDTIVNYDIESDDDSKTLIFESTKNVKNDKTSKDVCMESSIVVNCDSEDESRTFIYESPGKYYKIKIF